MFLALNRYKYILSALLSFTDHLSHLTSAILTHYGYCTIVSNKKIIHKEMPVGFEQT
jgi:hypothetical protein